MIQTTIRMTSVLSLIFAIALAAQPACAQATKGALETVKQTIDQVIKVNAQFPGEANTAQRRKNLREVIQPRFNFAEMAKRSLGTHWNEVTQQERDEFVSVFSDLLAQTYLNRIETVNDQMVKITGENLDLPRAVVKTTVENKGEKFPIDYKLIDTDGDWKVYDVVIENIGLVANYRNEFAGIIRKDGFAGLIQKLKDKVK